jgi:hypothetical protein
MTLLAIPIGSALLLAAVSLLFIERPKSGTDWPSFLAKCLLFATLGLASWAWQYSKYLGQHGIFYYASPKHGGLAATAVHIVMFVCCVGYLWRNRGRDYW